MIGSSSNLVRDSRTRDVAYTLKLSGRDGSWIGDYATYVVPAILCTPRNWRLLHVCSRVMIGEQGKHYMGAPRDFAPEMQKRALEN